MKKAKLLAVPVTLVLLCALAVGILMTGTSAANGVTEWTVDGTTYASVKEALTAAAGKSWAKDTSLLISVDPAKVASESISHDAGGTAYEGGIAFGQKTIFRADGTRLPITIQGSSDRTAFTLNITAGTKVACANSYTFKDLTFPIGDTSTSTYFYAGSGIVRLENVATSATTKSDGWLPGDNFTARAFDGWTEANVAANSNEKGLVTTSMGIGSGTKYISNISGSGNAKLLSHCVAVADSDGWEAFSGVTITPADTSAEFLVDGGEIGYMRGRIGTNPAGESVQRIEAGKVQSIFGLGTHNTTTTYNDRIHYVGDHTVIVNGGTISEYNRILFCAALDGDYTINITGGNFTSYLQPGWSPSTISGNFEMNVSGGSFNHTANCFYAHPSAIVEGTTVVNISGGTFAGPFQGAHSAVADAEGKYLKHNSYVINILPNAESASKDPVFNGDFSGLKNSKNSDFKSLEVNISAGTFNSFYCLSWGVGVGTAVNNVSGGTFKGAFYGGKVTNAGKVGSLTNNITGGNFEGYFYGAGQYSTETIPQVVNNVSGGTFKGSFYGGGENTKCYTDKIKNVITGGNFNSYFYGGSKATTVAISEIVNEFKGGIFAKAVMGGNLAGTVKKISNTVGSGAFNSNFYAAGEGGTVNEVTTTVTGGTIKGYYFGGLYSDATVDITNNIKGGTFEKIVMGAGRLKTTGDVTNTVSGGTFKSFFMGAGVVSEVDGNVKNTISGGTFERPVYGGSCDAVISGTITNDLSGPAKFNEGFCGVQGTTSKNGSTGAVINRIDADENGKAPVFLNPPAATLTYNKVEYDTGDSNGFAFLGGTTYGSVLGTITNTVEAGEFGTSSIGMYQGGNRNATIGVDENGVSIYNTVKGGIFHFRFYGGCLNYCASGETRTVVEDGIFEKEFTGGNRTVPSYDKPITTTIRGGEFLSMVTGTYFGYNADQSARGQVSSTITLNIEGGIFRGDIFGLGNRGAATTNYPTGSGIKEEGSVLVNLYGGTFYGNVYPTNETPEADNVKGLAQVTVEPKCGDVVLGKKMIPRIAAEKFLLKGGEYKILLDAKGKIEATSAEGEINFEQVDKWMNATYLTLPAGHNATVNVTTAKGAYGYFETVLGDKGEVIEVCGAALKMGASMILTDRIALKFQLSKEAVDAVENFTYSFTLPDGTVLAEGTKADLKEMMEITEFEYYTLISKSLGIGQFDTPITVNIKGLWENDTFSVSTLATAAVTAWEGNDNFVLMAKAIVNMAKAAKGEAVPYTLTPDEVVYERKTPTKDRDALVSFTNKSLLMSSAVGIRLSGTVGDAADVEGLVVKVNGNNVTDRALIRVDGTKLTVDLYFTAYGMSKEFRLEILDQNGKNCLTMYERLDSFATQYGREHALAYALLSYVQSTSAMTKASFNLTASEAEIEYLNSLYAGETAYYGDLHGHPGGGIIEDGKVDMSIWVADRTTIGVDFYTAMNHKQVAHMYDDGWDDTVLIGGSEPATTVTKDGAKISVHYNMIVPNPEALIEVLGLFPEFGYTGGTDDIALNMGTFGYPKFTYERFNELISAIKERGGTVVNVHPKQQHTSDNPLDYYYQDYMGLEVFYSYDDKNIHGKDSKANYDLWCDLLALGKRVWATAGSDSHGAPVNTGLTTLYASEALNTKYVEKLVCGNFAPGYAGIRMAIGDTEMGGHTDFAGKKLIFSVGDIHELYLSETRAYTVNVITDQGVVYSTVIDGTKTNYFSLDADENAAFYRIEVVDEELQGLPIVGLGNPIWND